MKKLLIILAVLSTPAKAIDLEVGIAITQKPIHYYFNNEKILGVIRVSDSFEINKDYDLVVDFTHQSMLLEIDPYYGINSVGISVKTSF